ncbi:hypothetical protein SFRURICE_017528 [Spodoptera frugiperda]|nr:hypothetical protein SFRURICE_017528 [Spodoptera frugiperda]
MASFEDLAFDWASLCQDCPECWTESDGVSVIGEGLFIMSSVRRRGDVAPPTPLIYIKSLNLSRMVTLTSVNLSDNSHKTATAVDELIEGGRGFDPFDPRLLSMKLDVELSLNGEQKHVTKTKSTSIVSLANLIKITPAVLEFMKNIYTAYKHIV